jgi:hypothetical protein
MLQSGFEAWYCSSEILMRFVFCRQSGFFDLFRPPFLLSIFDLFEPFENILLNGSCSKSFKIKHLFIKGQSFKIKHLFIKGQSFKIKHLFIKDNQGNPEEIFAQPSYLARVPPTIQTCNASSLNKTHNPIYSATRVLNLSFNQEHFFLPPHLAHVSR